MNKKLVAKELLEVAKCLEAASYANGNSKLINQYKEKRNAVKALIKGLMSNIDRHEKDFKNSGMESWGYLGDLGHVEEKLIQLNNFLE